MMSECKNNALCPSCGGDGTLQFTPPSTVEHQFRERTLTLLDVDPVTVKSAKDADRQAAARDVHIDKLRQPIKKKYYT